MGQKKTEETKTIMTEIVLPNDTNPLGYLLGGRLVYWMDMAAAVTAQAHAGSVAVTVSIDKVSFARPAKQGDIIYVVAKIAAVFSTSMIVHVEAWKRKSTETEKVRINEAWFTFVAIDENGKPKEVPGIQFVNRDEEEIHRILTAKKKID